MDQMKIESSESTSQGQLLAGHPIVSGTNPAVIRDALNEFTQDDHLVQLHRGHHLRGSVNGTRLGPIAFANVSYGTGVTIESPPCKERILVVVPRGPMFVEASSHRWLAHAPFALSSTEHTLMVPDPTRGALIGALDAAEAGQWFSTISGRTLQREIQLDSRLPLQLSAPEVFTRTWIESCKLIDSADPEQRSIFEKAMLGTIFSTLLLGLGPHLTCFDTETGVGHSRPPYLDMALDYMRDNYGHIEGIGAVAASVGISTRQLQTAFTKHMGRSPMQHLREVRLLAARRLLSAGETGTKKSVSLVATDVGFRHLGRFSAHYTKRFGEQPSHTSAGHQLGIDVVSAKKALSTINW